MVGDADLVLEQRGAFTGFTHDLGKQDKNRVDVEAQTPQDVIEELERRIGAKANLCGEESYVTFGRDARKGITRAVPKTPMAGWSP